MVLLVSDIIAEVHVLIVRLTRQWNGNVQW